MELNKLITMATVSKEFRRKLLTNPKQTLAESYQGQRISLTSQDETILLAHQANSLEELAEYIFNQQSKKKIIPPNKIKIIL